MKLSEMKEAMESPPEEEFCCSSTEPGVFDDEDFYEAIDLLETCRMQIQAALKYSPINPGRRHMLEKVSDDVRQFIDMFIVTEPEDDDKVEVLQP